MFRKKKRMFWVVSNRLAVLIKFMCIEGFWGQVHPSRGPSGNGLIKKVGFWHDAKALGCVSDSPRSHTVGRLRVGVRTRTVLIIMVKVLTNLKRRISSNLPHPLLLGRM